MNRTFKIFLLWLLISMLPMQAFAVSVSVACKPTHAMAEHAMAQHDAAHAENVDQQHAGHQQLASTAHDCADASCSACTTCCAALSAAANASTPATIHPMSESFATRLAAPDDSFIPAGLERPPKRA
ncbi:MAG: hypothetical protein ACI83P_002302 [Janthinobacterium sp.]|jgi:hypothetical protein